MYLIKQSSTAYALLFRLVDATDHVTPETGVTPTNVKLSKNNGAFAAPAGAVTELSDGWYRVAN